MTDTRLPLTLLTGFLGAGKTTLLNAILKDASSGRIAVIVNEFGETALDHDLIETKGEDIALMRSGCLCCSLRGELAGTVARLLERRATGELHFERIVIETTGLADPAPILHTLLSDRGLARTTRIDGVVTLADAVNGAATLDTQFEAVSQAAMADLIVLSKTDLATPDQRQRFEARLRAINSAVRIVVARHGRGMASQFWGLSGIRRDVAAPEALNWLTPRPATSDPLSNLSGFRPAPASVFRQSAHDGRIVTASITLDTPLKDAVFDAWINHMIGLRGDRLLRVKGIVFLEGIEFPFVFHGVQKVFEEPVPLRDWSGSARQSRVVAIARDVSHTRLVRDLARLRAGRSDG